MKVAGGNHDHGSSETETCVRSGPDLGNIQIQGIRSEMFLIFFAVARVSISMNWSCKCVELDSASAKKSNPYVIYQYAQQVL